MARPLVIAHRGGADLWPENTLAAFAGAIACGADGAELDVHLSADGEVIVYHDEALKPELTRDANSAWLPETGPLLKTLTFAETQAYDIGQLEPGTAYAGRHPVQQAQDGERIPRLADVIALALARSATFQLWIELKTDLLEPERGADPLRLADRTLDLVYALGFSERTVFVSFDWRALAQVKRRSPTIPSYATTLPLAWFSPEAPRGPGLPPPDELARYRTAMAAGALWEAGAAMKDHPSVPHAVKTLGADGWFPFYQDLTSESLAQARSLGLKSAAWTVPASDLTRLTALGIDALCTDDPVTALSHL